MASQLPWRRRVMPVAGRWRRRWLIVTAAAAVTVVVAVSWAALASGGSAATAAGPAFTATSGGGALQSVPPYYLALVAVHDSPGPLYRAVIRSTRTGATLATITPPEPYRTFTVATGARDDRTFVLAAQPRPSSGNDPAAFYGVRFSPATGKVTVVELPVRLPAGDQLTGFSLSPDGTRLAIAAATGEEGQGSELRIYSLTTGAVRVWQGQGAIGYGFPDCDDQSMSWASDGVLAFNWSSAANDPSGVWLLNTATAGGNLLAASKFAVSTFGSGFQSRWDGVIAQDGRTIIAPMARFVGDIKMTRRTAAALYRRFEVWGEFGVFAAATGRQTGTLWPVHSTTPPEAVLWSNPSGTVLIVAVGGRGKNSIVGVLRGQRLTPLPAGPSWPAMDYPVPPAPVF